MGNIQVGGKVPKNGGRQRIERPFAGVIAGLSINRLRALDMAAERDPQSTIRGDVQLVTGVLDRNDLQRMQQVRFLNERQFIILVNVYIDCRQKQKPIDFTFKIIKVYTKGLWDFNVELIISQ